MPLHGQNSWRGEKFGNARFSMLKRRCLNPPYPFGELPIEDVTIPRALRKARELWPENGSLKSLQIGQGVYSVLKVADAQILLPRESPPSPFFGVTVHEAKNPSLHMPGGG